MGALRGAMGLRLLGGVLAVFLGAARAACGDELPRSVRMPAEFEPTASVIMQWTPGDFDAVHTFLADRVQHAGAELMLIVADADHERRVRVHLAREGVPAGAIRFLQAAADSVWTRDYAAMPVYLNAVSSRAFVDWRFSCNTARHQFASPNDDRIPPLLASEFGVPLRRADGKRNGLVMEGGDLLTDGFGTGFCSALLPELNGGDAEAVRRVLGQQLGLNRVIVLERMRSGPDNHIDMYMKLLDEETILLGEYQSGDGGVIARNLRRIERANSCYGTPYRIVRIPMPGSYRPGDYRSYTNALIVNNRVLVPLYGLDTDEEALAIYREAMPGYDVEGYDCNELITHGGAIHCITREVAPPEVVRVAHPRFRGSLRAHEPAQFRAEVLAPREPASVTLHVLAPGAREYIALRMARSGGGCYAAEYIPAAPGELRYYIEADCGGIRGYKPQNGREGGYLAVEVLPGAVRWAGAALPDRTADLETR
jgi:agmatine deiminase